MDAHPHRNESQLLEELAKRIQQQRLTRGWPQAELARRAGVSKRTIERLEQGSSVQLGNWLRVLQALDLVDILENLMPAEEIGPMEQLRHPKRTRQRAPRHQDEKPDAPWQWSDES